MYKKIVVALMSMGVTVAFAGQEEINQISDIRNRICSGEVTAQDVAKFWLNRAKNLDNYNAFSSFNELLTIEQAKNVDKAIKSTGKCPDLAGVPFAIKDNIEVKGFVNTGGTYALRDYHPSNNASTIQKIVSAGGVILGKTAMQELAFGISGFNPNYQSDVGTGVKNAHNIKKIPGGSSSGSGAAVGSNIAPIAFGTDTGGSVSIPCSLNGCVGFRPTTLRYSTSGIIPISFSRDTPGTMAHSVADVIAVDNVITGINTLPTYSKIKLGMPNFHWTDLDDETAHRSKLLINALKKSGIEIVDIELEGAKDLANKIGMPIALYEAREELISYLKKSSTGLSIQKMASEINSPDVYSIINNVVIPSTLDGSGSQPDLESLYIEGIKKDRPALLRIYEKVFEENNLDGLIFPTTPEVAIDSNAEASSPQNFARFIRNTDMGSIIRLPTITLPMGLGPKSRLPIGISIESLPNHDRNILSIAQKVELIISNTFK